MKIAHIINTFKIGGAEKLVYDYYQNIEMFNSSKIDFFALTSRNKKLTSHNDKINFLSNNSEYNPLLIFRLMSIVNKYDIVHIHLFPTLYWVLIAKIISFSKVKVIYTEHSTQNNRSKYKVFKYLDRFFYSYINEVVAVSNGVANELNRRNIINKKKIKVITNGIVLPNDVKYKKTNSNNFMLLQISRFSYQKDHETLIKSLNYLPKDIHLELVGDGETKTQIEFLVKDLGLEKRVIFHGELTNFENIIEKSDVIILASNFEGLPLSILEGMAYRKPVIGSNIEGLREVVKGYGFLYEPKNEVDLARYIRDLYFNQCLHSEIAEKCYTRAKFFSIESHIIKLNILYDQVK